MDEVSPGNTLVLFCLNGVFYHFVNDRLAAKMAPSLTGMIELTLAGLAVTICSILLAVPAIPLCNRFIPWLVGYRSGNRPEYVVKQELSQQVAERCGRNP